MKSQDTYYEADVIVHKDGGISRVLRPILTDEERERRINNIKKATAEFMRHVYEVEKKKKSENAGDNEGKTA